MPPRLESLLSARLHLSPQIVGDRIYFISNLSGRLSLYAMYYGGSVPQPLLPPGLALPNPGLIEGRPFCVFPLLDQILVMLDHDGDEIYQPMLIPVEGGFPEPAFADSFTGRVLRLGECDPDRNLLYFNAERLDEPLQEAWRCDLRTKKIEKLAESKWGAFPSGLVEDHSKVFISDFYTFGDTVLYLLQNGQKSLLFGKPLNQRQPGEEVPLNGLNLAQFTPSGTAALVMTAVFDDRFSLGLIDFTHPGEIQPVKLDGLVHTGLGELKDFSHLRGSHYALHFNIDGCSWLYEGLYNEEKCLMALRHVIVGDGDLASGVLQHYDYDKAGDRFVLSFSTATSPTQLYTVESRDRQTVVMHTDEKLLGLPESQLSPGEDASFVSFDGTRMSARLYLPAEYLGYTGARPLVYYIHGGPQGQERPDFSWFSMPLIQFLTLRGFAVFVPNVRGSTGYGLDYTSQVDHDWGGQDRLDHVHAMTKVLPLDKRLDVKRAAVVGRSYGGYMTLTLAGRHPELWSAACDMFGPYDLLTFSESVPEAWKPNLKISLADPETTEGRLFLQERSPKTWLDALACPLLVIQGRNDPRVVARESEDLVANLQKKGKQVQLLIFEDEGHDVLKYTNRVTCYNAITDFFIKQLNP
jgi:pimeloyl-ACP methyl ester carboxylesterase